MKSAAKKDLDGPANKRSKTVDTRVPAPFPPPLRGMSLTLPPPTSSPMSTVPIWSLGHSAPPPTYVPSFPSFPGFGGLGSSPMSFALPPPTFTFPPPSLSSPFHLGGASPSASVVQHWQPPKQQILSSIQQNLTSPPPPPVDHDFVAYNRHYSDSEVVQRFGYPDSSTEQRQRQLAQDLDDHIRKVDAEVTSEERPKHLPKPLQQRVRAELGHLAPLNLANNSLGTAWDDALVNYRGGMKGIPLYKAIRSSPKVRKSIDDIGVKAKSTKTPEYHHLLKKQRHPDLATKPRNLSVLSRGDRNQSGQHDLLHRLFAGGQGNIYVEAVPAVEREVDDLTGLGAYKTLPSGTQSQRVLKHL